MSGVGGIIYDKDAVYIDIGQKDANKKNEEDEHDEVRGSFFFFFFCWLFIVVCGGGVLIKSLMKHESPSKVKIVYIYFYHCYSFLSLLNHIRGVPPSAL